MCYCRELICLNCLDDTTGVISLTTCSKHVKKGFCNPDTIAYYFKYRVCQDCKPICLRMANWSSAQIHGYIQLMKLPLKVIGVTQRVRRLKHFGSYEVIILKFAN